MPIIMRKRFCDYKTPFSHTFAPIAQEGSGHIQGVVTDSILGQPLFEIKG